MTPKEIRTVIDAWIAEFKTLASMYTWVQIFENKGASMGCSNPHPHCQIWACSFFPNEPRVKDKKLREYYQKNGTALLDDYTRKEITRKVWLARVVQNMEFALHSSLDSSSDCECHLKI